MANWLFAILELLFKTPFRFVKLALPKNHWGAEFKSLSLKSSTIWAFKSNPKKRTRKKIVMFFIVLTKVN
jgi:hypothetical protein